MKKTSFYTILLTILLSFTSFAIYIIQLILYHSPRDTTFYFFQDIAFLPLQIAIVTIVIGKILNDREKKERIKKLNMTISVFYSEVGTELMMKLIQFITSYEELKPYLNISDGWSNKDFQKSAAFIKNYNVQISSTTADLQHLKSLLMLKRFFLFNMLENPNLLEHETFTDMLWSILHLADELLARENFDTLPDTDIKHLEIDIKRTVNAILVQWIGYMSHLKSDYPYLFSLEIRKNPFNNDRDIIIR